MHNRFAGIAITFILACFPVQIMMCGSISAQTTLDRKDDIADRLLNQGFQQYEDKQYETALKSWQEALVIYREVKDVEGEYKAIQFLGLTYQLLGDHNKVIEYKLQQLLIMRQIRDIQDEDKVLEELGIAYLNIRNYGKAIQYLQQQLVTAKKLRKQDFDDKANILNNLSVAYYSLGIYAQSIDYKLQQLAIVRKKGDKQTEYKILEFLSSVYKMLGNSNRASDYNQQLLSIEKEMGRQTRVTVSDIETLNFTPMNSKKETRLGKLQSGLSELQNIKTPDLLDRIGSYISCKESSNPERCNLSDLGRSTSNNYYVNNQENIEFLKLRIREIETKQRDGDELGRLGISSFAIGNYEKAIEYQLKWLNAAEEIEDIHVKEVALTNLGIAYRNLGKYDTAINYLLQGLILARENKDKLRELKILGNLSIVYRDLHKYNEVIKYIRQGVELTRETVDKESNFTSLVNVRISFYSLCTAY